jgi:hypothetical protein
MGLWSDLFAGAARDDAAILSPGRSYEKKESPKFPYIGETISVSNGASGDLDAILTNGLPTVVGLYSNCCCGELPMRNLEALAQQLKGYGNFVAVNVNGLVAFPPPWHPEAKLRGRT